MTSRPWKSWPAQSPSPDFASRAVGVLLEQQTKVVPLRRRRRRWAALLACAAALAVGTSWAMVRYAGPKRPEPAAVVALTASSESVQPPRKTSTARFVALPPASEPSVQPPPPAPPAPVIAASSAPASSASAPPTRPKVIVVPRCNCEPGTQICACVH